MKKISEADLQFLRTVLFIALLDEVEGRLLSFEGTDRLLDEVFDEFGETWGLDFRGGEKGLDRMLAMAKIAAESERKGH